MKPKDVKSERKNVRILLHVGEVEEAENSRPPKKDKVRDYTRTLSKQHSASKESVLEEGCDEDE